MSQQPQALQKYDRRTEAAVEQDQRDHGLKVDGVLVLNLRAMGPGVVGDARVTYAPSDVNYAKVLAHLGGIKPGESKPVPPWGRLTVRGTRSARERCEGAAPR